MCWRAKEYRRLYVTEEDSPGKMGRIYCIINTSSPQNNPRPKKWWIILLVSHRVYLLSFITLYTIYFEMYLYFVGIWFMFANVAQLHLCWSGNFHQNIFDHLWPFHSSKDVIVRTLHHRYKNISSLLAWFAHRGKEFSRVISPLLLQSLCVFCRGVLNVEI